MRPRTLPVVVWTTAAAVVATIVAASCRRPEPPPETRLLVLDGIEILLADVEPYVQYLDSFRPDLGRKSKIQSVLDGHLIPLRLAQRAFPEQRRAQRQRAADLRAVAATVDELERQSALIQERRRSEPTRLHLPPPVAQFAFDPLHVGAVSDPLELPHGFVLAGVHDLRESPGLMVQDYVDLLQVGFLTHTSAQWAEFYAAEKTRLAGLATFVHPDYVHAMPAWLELTR